MSKFCKPWMCMLLKQLEHLTHFHRDWPWGLKGFQNIYEEHMNCSIINRFLSTLWIFLLLILVFSIAFLNFPSPYRKQTHYLDIVWAILYKKLLNEETAIVDSALSDTIYNRQRLNNGTFSSRSLPQINTVLSGCGCTQNRRKLLGPNIWHNLQNSIINIKYLHRVSWLINL